MGLDNYWVEVGSTKPSGSKEMEDCNLCGGMLSGSGFDSFRGKVYNQYVEHVTGVSLYENRIDNNTVKAMAAKLAEAQGNINRTSFEIEDSEIKDLVRMFQVHADDGHELIAWY